MRKPVLCIALTATLAALVAPASAASTSKPKPLVVKDAAGDANFVNSQGGLLPADPGSVPTPVQDAGADIVSFSLNRLAKGKKVVGFVASMTLSAAPTADRNFRIRMSTDDCGTFMLEYNTSSTLGSTANLRHVCGASATPTAEFTDVPATVKGSTITWTFPMRGLPGDLKVGDLLTVEGAQVSVNSGATILPGVDEVVVQKAYKIGQ